MSGTSAFHAIRQEDEPADAYLAESQLFKAERYGGHGVGTNGGGARCGFDGHVQVKGIGRTSLVGSDADRWHGHGGANLEEAIREAVWGEISHYILPHGGVRTLGIVATGTFTQFEGSKGARLLPRVLILREPALRPAHYMRAINFFPCDEFPSAAPSDAERTQHAVLTLPHGLAVALSPETPEHQRSTPEFVNECLITFVKRVASQQAAARAKRIPHGAVNCSNIALDGRYIDFETMSSISDYGRVILARGNPDLWTESIALSRTLVHLCFYVRNYSPAEWQSNLLDAQTLNSIYIKHYKARLDVEYLKLTGMPEEKLSEIDPALKNEVSNCFTEIVKHGNSEPFKVPQMPARMGRYHLNSMLASKMHAHSRNGVGELNQHIDEPGLAARTNSALNALLQAYQATFPTDHRDTARHTLAAHAARLNQTQPELVHAALEREVVSLIDEHGRRMHWVTDFIEQHVRDACRLRADPPACGLSTAAPASLKPLEARAFA